jgi:hypothetical protein
MYYYKTYFTTRQSQVNIQVTNQKSSIQLNFIHIVQINLQQRVIHYLMD